MAVSDQREVVSAALVEYLGASAGFPFDPDEAAALVVEALSSAGIALVEEGDVLTLSERERHSLMLLLDSTTASAHDPLPELEAVLAKLRRLSGGGQP